MEVRAGFGGEAVGGDPPTERAEGSIRTAGGAFAGRVAAWRPAPSSGDGARLPFASVAAKAFDSSAGATRQQEAAFSAALEGMSPHLGHGGQTEPSASIVAWAPASGERVIEAAMPGTQTMRVPSTGTALARPNAQTRMAETARFIMALEILTSKNGGGSVS